MKLTLLPMSDHSMATKGAVDLHQKVAEAEMRGEGVQRDHATTTTRFVDSFPATHPWAAVMWFKRRDPIPLLDDFTPPQSQRLKP